ncbi:hypothetical protein FRC08_007296 [Ceratobasidium sp. 394]|nr:hypothetical protein FRC08_007296 [Ceratobasidium sp. 394]KAG9091858.1 hypothetical protein FS749_016179 [Ceratobasidium sp. UAMH 11750]
MSQPIPDGIYTIDAATMYQSGTGLAQFSPLEGPEPGSRLVIQHPDESGKGSTTWEVKFDSARGAYTFKNPHSGHYCGYEGEPEMNMQLHSSTAPGYWELVPAEGEHAGENTFYIHAQGTDILLSQSPLMIYPPLAALQPIDSPFTAGMKMPWKFIQA